MPKPTYFNLPETKARLFLQAAFEEFTSLPYQLASITSLVKHLGIAKGSAYQYFENKKDLYQYLIYVARNRKLEYLQEVTDRDDQGFWELVKHLVEANLKFDLENPLQSRFLYTVSLEKFSNEVGDLRSEQIIGNITTLKYLLEKEKSRGKLRDDISAELMGFMITQLILGMPDYLAYRYPSSGMSEKPYLRHHYRLTEKQIDDVVDELVRLIKNGLRKTKKK